MDEKGLRLRGFLSSSRFGGFPFFAPAGIRGIADNFGLPSSFFAP
jgi:hypothetical protein